MSWSPSLLVLRCMQVTARSLLLASLAASLAMAQPPVRDDANEPPPPTATAPERIVVRRPDDPIFHRTVERLSIPAWSPDHLHRVVTSDVGALAGATLIQMHSEPGDYIGAGQDHLYRPSDGTFTVSATPNHVSIYFSNNAHFWFLDFAAPQNTPLKVQSYTGATRYPFNATNDPGLSVSGDGRGCNQLTGTFRVRQIQFSATGALQSFWATFEQHCEGGAPALTGEVRINATVNVTVTAPLTQHIRFGEPLALGVNAATVDSSIVTLTASPVPPGGSFTDHRDNTGTLDWRPGIDEIGKHRAVQFVGTMASGLQDSTTSDIVVDGLTQLIMSSEVGDYIGAGLEHSYGVQDGTFSVGGNRNHVSVSFSSQSHFWFLDFSAPNNAALAVGTYEGATRYPFNSTNVPGLDVAGDGRGCNQLSGRFQVKEISFNPNGTLASFRAAFEQHCEGNAPALTGEVRYNARLAVDIRAPLARSVPIGRTLNVPITASAFTGGHVSFSATGLPPAATLTDHGDNSAEISWKPLFDDIGVSKVVTVFASLATGERDSTTITLSATGVTSARLSSEPGEYIGQGREQLLTTDEWQVSLTGTRRNVSVRFTKAGSFFDATNFDFAAPAGRDLVPGLYTGAVRYPFQSGTQPGMSITAQSRGCGQVTGRFWVRQIEFTPSGVPSAVRITFEQLCDGNPALLTGELRVNAKVPLSMVPPTVNTGAEGLPLELPVRAEVFDGHAVSLSALDLPAGASFLDHGDGTGVLKWLPGIHQLGDYPIRYRAANNFGSADTAASALHIQGVTSLVVVSDSGEAIGRGARTRWTTRNATFTAQRNSQGGVNVTAQDSTFNNWRLDFAAGSSLPLEVNVYNNAVGYPSFLNTSPSMSVSRNFVSCSSTLTGRFVVQGVRYGTSNSIPMFWATFEQRCSAGAPALRGEVRFNADPNLLVFAPDDVVVSEGDPVSYDVRALVVPGARATISLQAPPAGARLVDHGDNTATFEWVPGFQQQGEYQVNVLVFDGLGAVDSSSTRIVVRNKNQVPVAAVGGPYRAAPGSIITFDGSASRDPDGDVLQLQWDFGDGARALGVTAQHAYAVAGNYRVMLIASDGLLSDTDSTVAVVGTVPPPTVACPRRRTWWRDHPETWPATTLTLGRLSYAQDVLLQILRRSLGDSESDMSLKLGAELVSAKFNVLKGARAAAGDAAIASADSLIGNRRIPFSVRDKDRNAYDELARRLRDFNRGRFNPGCHVPSPEDGLADEDGMSEPRFEGIRVSPNPFTSASRISFMLPREGMLRVTVLDLQGREVRVLHSGVRAAGLFDIEWDGRDPAGRQLGSGVYFYRVEGTMGSVLKKIVRIQ